jgi:thiamine pyrophosphokinase
MKRAVVFTNGNLSNIDQTNKIIKKEDCLIAADGAVGHILKLGLTPKIIIGDLDSTSSTLQKKLEKFKVRFIKYPRKKDKTDFELTIDYCLKNKFQEIIIFGVLGDRIDHLIANILLIARTQNEKKSIKIKIIEGRKEIYVLNKNIEISGQIGDELSVVPISQKLEGIVTRGLEYRLNDETLLLGSTRGISNVFNNNLIKVNVKKGIALIIHLRK